MRGPPKLWVGYEAPAHRRSCVLAALERAGCVVRESVEDAAPRGALTGWRLNRGVQELSLSVEDRGERAVFAFPVARVQRPLGALVERVLASADGVGPAWSFDWLCVGPVEPRKALDGLVTGLAINSVDATISPTDIVLASEAYPACDGRFEGVSLRLETGPACGSLSESGGTFVAISMTGPRLWRNTGRGTVGARVRQVLAPLHLRCIAEISGLHIHPAG